MHGLLARLHYGAGLRIEEALQLRAKDLDFANLAIFVRAGKGDKDRIVMLPRSLSQEPVGLGPRRAWSGASASRCVR